jgi:mono/diheme cytochrome c family protein
MSASRSRLVVRATVWTVCLLTGGVALNAQDIDRSGMSGQQLYQAACDACHGPDGKGQPLAIRGFDIDPPDFTDCGFATPEADLDWSSIVHMGGPVRALDQMMPAFGDALSDDDIDRTIQYIRGFCTELGWPRGDLNFPRTFFTEKAYPENEAVLTTMMASHAIENVFLYERRIGRRAQYEITVPIALREGSTGRWRRGLGDVSVALKYAFFDNVRTGSIAAAGGEIVFPTGKETEGLGGGVTIFEAFGMFNQALPRDGFMQVHAGFELPANRNDAHQEVYWRTALGKTYTEQIWGRAWSPMVELLGAKELGATGGVEWDLVPQLQVSLSGLQHVLVNVGVRLPVNERAGRDTTVVVYLLWDWFDGGLFSNW